MPKTQCFNNHYQEYDNWFERNRFAYLSELEAVKHFIPAEGEGLEVGVGSGQFAKPLGIQKGLEPSAAMRKLAEKLGLEVCDGVAEALPFQDMSFDYVTMITTICFLDDAHQAFREVHRILRQDGTFIIGLVDKESPLGQIYAARKLENVFYKDATFYSVQDVLDLLNENGFAGIEIIQTVFGSVGSIDHVQAFTDGHGEGGFVVIKAIKG